MPAARYILPPMVRGEVLAEDFSKLVRIARSRPRRDGPRPDLRH